jgi:hypothetical protein
MCVYIYIYIYVIYMYVTNSYILHMKTMSTITRDSRPHYISMPNIDERTVHKETLLCARKW